jgi:hypothetical protein
LVERIGGTDTESNVTSQAPFSFLKLRKLGQNGFYMIDKRGCDRIHLADGGLKW